MMADKRQVRLRDELAAAFGTNPLADGMNHPAERIRERALPSAATRNVLRYADSLWTRRTRTSRLPFCVASEAVRRQERLPGAQRLCAMPWRMSLRIWEHRPCSRWGPSRSPGKKSRRRFERGQGGSGCGHRRVWATACRPAGHSLSQRPSDFEEMAPAMAMERHQGRQAGIHIVRQRRSAGERPSFEPCRGTNAGHGMA